MAENRHLQLVLELKDKLSKQLKGVSSDVQKAGAKMKSIDFKKIGAGVAVISGALAFAGKKFVDLASDMEETENRFTTLFGNMSDDVDKWSETLGQAVGRNVTDIKDGLSSFKGMATGLGFAGEQASQMAQDLQRLSIDFASFNNLTDGEAQQRFISAMSGSAEVLDKFGINTKASAIDLELLAMGLDKNTASATEAEKATARYNIIMATMGEQGAVGDAIKTSESYANQVKRLQSNLKTLGEEIGQKIIPIVNKAVTAVNGIIETFKGFDFTVIKNNETLQFLIQLFKNLATTFAETLGPELAKLWEALQPLLPFFTMLAKILGVTLLAAIVAVTKILQTGLVIAVKALTLGLKTVNVGVQMFSDGWNAVVTVVKTVISWVDKLIQKLKSLNVVSRSVDAIKGAFSSAKSVISGARANGGSVSSGKSFLVGERGPEVFTPSSNGRITSNRNMGGGGISLNVVVNGDISGKELIEKVSDGIMNTLRTQQRLSIAD